MQNFTLEVDGDGIALVTFDMPGRSVNVISQGVQQDLDQLIASIGSDDDIRGAILRSGKASGFCVGADLTELPDDIARWSKARTPAEIGEAVADASGFSRRLRAIETCGKPIVAVIDGAALGGGLELALACHYRIAVDDTRLRLGLPEATLGLMPGAGGTQRLPRLMGINAALPHLLNGTPVPIAEAKAAGLVHATAQPDRLIETARAWIVDGGRAAPAWDEKGYRIHGGGPFAPAAYSKFGAAIATQRGRSGGAAPAAANILKAVYEGSQVPIDAGLRIESRYFFNTIRTDGVIDKIHDFLASRR